jgi:hypothetical protein
VKTVLPLKVATALGLLAVLPGCGSPDRPATWAYISPVIFQPNCASGSCHSPAAAVAGLDFSDPDKGYASLTRLWVWIVDRSKEGQPGCGKAAGRVVCERLFRPLITPYDPGQSRLVNMLRGRNAPCMPPDRPLDEADIRLVENWILNGAKKSETESEDAAATDAGGDTSTELGPDSSTDSTDSSSDSSSDDVAGEHRNADDGSPDQVGDAAPLDGSGG